MSRSILPILSVSFLRWVFITNFLTTNFLFGQAVNVPAGWPLLRVIDVEQGLPQAFVSSVVQDQDGFTWVGTLGGLARYDGRHMQPFPTDATTPHRP
jgi:hypothetical protein